MAKPLNEFGGWLKFFQIINVFLIILILLYFVSTAYFAAGAFSSKIPFTKELKLSIVFMFTLFPLLYFFTGKILRLLKVKSPEVPDDISRYIVYIIIVSVSAGIAEILFFHSGDFSKFIFSIFKSVIQPLVINIIWLAYFRRSKRVKEFYGENASLFKSST